MASLSSKGNQDVLWKITLLLNFKNQRPGSGLMAYDGHMGHNVANCLLRYFNNNEVKVCDMDGYQKLLCQIS